jgi:putative ATP-dependent endonuclease of OLD family
MKLRHVHVHNLRSMKDADFGLEDYCVLVGCNNAGKTNLLDAVRLFYEQGIKYDENRDRPTSGCSDGDSWIEMTYELQLAEEQALPQKYRLSGSHLKIRKYLCRRDGKLGMFAYEGDSLSEDSFFGAKAVQQGKVGTVTYVPAVDRLEDESKLSGPSPFRELLTTVLDDVVRSGHSFRKLSEDIADFSGTITAEENASGKSLGMLEKELTGSLASWGSKFAFVFHTPNAQDIVKSLVDFVLTDPVSGLPMNPSQFGDGMQRHLLYSLISLAGEYSTRNTAQVSDEFRPQLSLLIFEEPEAFLHPQQQDRLSASLRKLATSDGHQVIISTHSPEFLNRSTDSIPSIVHVVRSSGQTTCGQVTEISWKELCDKNQAANDLAAHGCVVPDADVDTLEWIKYFMWLDASRCRAFLSDSVLLVEGPTERVLIDYMQRNGLVPERDGDVRAFVMDTGGKWNMPRFMNLFGQLCVPHSVLFDGDRGKTKADEWVQLIEGSANDCTRLVSHFETDIEGALGLELHCRKDEKPLKVVKALMEGSISQDRMHAFAELSRELLDQSASMNQ